MAAAAGPALSLGAHTPGDVFKDCDHCPELVVIPAGSFVMGNINPGPEAGEQPAELKPILVRISRPFAMGRYEVTRREFGKFARATDYEPEVTCRIWDAELSRFRDADGRSWARPGFPPDLSDNLPVTCVDFGDAQRYLNWLSAETGQRYRLPSESEWEYAAKAGTQTARFWGDDPFDGCDYANTFDLTAKRVYSLGWPAAPCADGFADLAPAGSLAPNQFGLHDMIGNVWEWVEDCSAHSYIGRPKDERAWVWEGGCVRRVQRGGGWITAPARSRTAFHGDGRSTDRSVFFGFRVVRELESEEAAQ